MQKDYVNLDLNEKDLQESQKYLLTVFHLKPKGDLDLVSVASEVAAESSTGTSVKVHTFTNFAKDLDALVYKVDREKNLVWIAYPWIIFDRGGNVQNILTYIVGNIFGMHQIDALKLLDVWFPEKMLENYDGPSYTIDDMKAFLGIKKDNDRPVLGTIVKPKIGLNPKEFAKVSYDFWAGGGDFVKNDEPQSDQEFCPFDEMVLEVKDAWEKAVAQTGKNKVMSFNVSAGDFDTMIQRADFIKKHMPENSYAFLVDGITAGWAALQTIRRRYPNVYLHFHRAMHGAFTREENPIGFTVPVLTQFARLAGSSGLHTGTAGVGKMAGGKEDIMALHFALDDVVDEYDFQTWELTKDLSSEGFFYSNHWDSTLLAKSEGFFFVQNWHGMKKMNPIISGGLNPLKLHKFLDLARTTDFITTMGGGVHGHPGGTFGGAKALVQACEAYQKGMSIEEYAKDHKELMQAIEFYTKNDTSGRN